MGTLPTLEASGIVRFASRADAAELWADGPGAGTLVVRPMRAVAPQLQLTLTLLVPGLDPIVVRGEVVHLDQQHATVRLHGGGVRRPAGLDGQQVAASAPHHPFARPSSPPATVSATVPATASATRANDRPPTAATPAPNNPFARPSTPPSPAAHNPFARPPATPPSPPPSATVSEAPRNPFARPPTSPAADEAATGAPPRNPFAASMASTPASTLASRTVPGTVQVPPRAVPAQLPRTTSIEADAPMPPPGNDDDDAWPPTPTTPTTPTTSGVPRTSTATPASPHHGPDGVGLGAPLVGAPSASASATTKATAADVAWTRTATSAGARVAPDASSSSGLPQRDTAVVPATPSPPTSLGERSATAIIDGGATTASVAAHLPPFFTDDALRFATPADLESARAELLAVGAVLAVADTKPPLQTVDIRLLVGEREARGRVRCAVYPMQPGTVVVQAQDKAAWVPLLQQLVATNPAPPTAPAAGEANTSAAATSMPPAPARGLTFGRSGHLWNPRTIEGLLAVPAHRPVTDADVRRPSLPLLLRWLRTTRGVLRVDFASAGEPVHTVIVVDGRELRSPVALPSLARALAVDEFDYELHELPRAPTVSHSLRTLHLMAEVLRCLLGRHDPDAIARAFPHTKDERLVRAVTSVADALAFPPTHTRLIKQALSGDEAVADVLKNPIGQRTAWDILVLLELFGGLQFVAGERRAAAAATPGVGHVTPEMMLEKDLFGVLGLHWSSAPTEIEAGYSQARQLWSGPKRPDDPALAQRVLARIDEAHRTLRDDVRRQDYRRATFNLVWSHQAQLLVAQAKLALYRKDLAEARRLLSAAEDCSPSGDAAQLLLALSSAKRSAQEPAEDDEG